MPVGPGKGLAVGVRGGGHGHRHRPGYAAETLHLLPAGAGPHGAEAFSLRSCIVVLKGDCGVRDRGRAPAWEGKKET